MRFPETLTNLFPRTTAFWMLVHLADPTLKVFVPGGRQRLGLAVRRDVVPEFLDEFELLGSGEPEEFFAKGVRCTAKRSREIGGSRVRMKPIIVEPR